MPDEVICPDCGGIVGADPGETRQVCTCFRQRLTPVIIPPIPEVEPAPVVEKLCRICGKNLVGHRRLKDSLGYLCLECDKADRTPDDGLIACGECGRKLKPMGLVDYAGTMICRSCYKDHQEMDKFQAPPPNLSVYDNRDKRTLKVLLIIGGVLGIIVLLSHFHVIGH